MFSPRVKVLIYQFKMFSPRMKVLICQFKMFSPRVKVLICQFKVFSPWVKVLIYQFEIYPRRRELPSTILSFECLVLSFLKKEKRKKNKDRLKKC
ncbi:hypothetical protein BPO_0040 [Bergeyella porcorum]|uniref:Uncharacterized protein n=1 Tax=Bergeyella porcorum TaxID=1735111 RepID=A0AAU0F1N2_9FLAO